MTGRYSNRFIIAPYKTFFESQASARTYLVLLHLDQQLGCCYSGFIWWDVALRKTHEDIANTLIMITFLSEMRKQMYYALYVIQHFIFPEINEQKLYMLIHFKSICEFCFIKGTFQVQSKLGFFEGKHKRSVYREKSICSSYITKVLCLFIWLQEHYNYHLCKDSFGLFLETLLLYSFLCTVVILALFQDRKAEKTEFTNFPFD